MYINLQQVIKTIILGVFALYFIMLHRSGHILKYVNPKYEYISKIALVLFLFLFVIQIFRILQPRKQAGHVCSAGCDHDHHGNGVINLRRIFGYSIIVFPIITGFAMEPATLNAKIAGNKGLFAQISKGNDDPSEKPSLTENAETFAEKEDIDIYSDEYNPIPNNNYMSEEEFSKKQDILKMSETIQMNEDMFSSFYGEINVAPQDYIGRKIKMSGFVFKEEGFNSDQLVLSRFMITHCLADASVLGFLTQFDEANLLEEDTWLEMEGVLDVTTYDGYEMPIIKVTSWKVIDEPEEPYIFPVLTIIQ
jgi:putative membrane protein